MRRLSVITAVLVAVLSCSKEDVFTAEDLVAMEGLGLWEHGNKSYDFKTNYTQFGRNVSSGEYRLSNDTMADFVIVRTKNQFCAGTTVRVDIIWTATVDVKTKNNLEMEVLRVEGDKVRLWNSKNSIGIIFEK